MHILQTATQQLFKKGMACHPDPVFPSHSMKVTCIIKAIPPLPSSRSPETSYITGVMELAPLSPFLKITHSPPGIISDKFRHKPFEYSARSSSVATLLPNRDPNNTPLLVFLACGGNIIFFICFSKSVYHIVRY